MRINGARPPHSGQMTGAARESCAGARNVGIASPRGTPQVLEVCKGTTALSIVFGTFFTAKTRSTVAGGAVTKIYGTKSATRCWSVCRLPNTSGTFVKRKAKPLDKRTAQLDGALALFG